MLTLVRVLLCALVPTLSITPASAEVVDTSEVAGLAQTARQAVKGLVSSLQSELKAALKDGGPVHAVGVCKIIAPTIAAAQSEEYGMSIGRTALRVRNPANAPDEFEIRVMQTFSDRLKAGADAKMLEHSEIVRDTDGQRTFRYLKAIPMAAKPCAACHGTTIDETVLQTIRSEYPSDQATGFKPGDLRGVFTVSKTLPRS